MQDGSGLLPWGHLSLLCGLRAPGLTVSFLQVCPGLGSQGSVASQVGGAGGGCSSGVWGCTGKVRAAVGLGEEWIGPRDGTAVGMPHADPTAT